MLSETHKLFLLTSAFGGLAGGVVLLRDHFASTCVKLDDTVKADGKVIVITGANRGIGKETAKELARRGGIVYMACRDMKSCNKTRDEIIRETNNDKVFCKLCDLSDLKSIRKFVHQFRNQERRIDILINNAGIKKLYFREETKQRIEMQIGVNHMGHFLLTNLLIDLLKKSAPSRIVVVSCNSYEKGKMNFDDLNSEKSYYPLKVYEQSKLANILFTKELSERLDGSQCTINAVHPGLSETEKFKNIFSSFLLRPIYNTFFTSPRQEALTCLYVALDPSLKNVNGKYFSDCKIKPLTAQANDSEAAKKLWQTSFKWTKM